MNDKLLHGLLALRLAGNQIETVYDASGAVVKRTVEGLGDSPEAPSITVTVPHEDGGKRVVSAYYQPAGHIHIEVTGAAAADALMQIVKGIEPHEDDGIRCSTASERRGVPE